MAIDISSTTRRIVYTGSAGTGPYAFAFNILVNTDLAVYFNDTELTLTTDYTVAISADGTGSVTIVVGTNVPTTPDADDRITIVGDRTIQRTTDFTTGGPLFAASLNDELDSLTIFTQQNLEQSNRSLRAPNTDPTTVNMELPDNTTRANKTLAFDANGDPVIGEQIGDYRGNWAASTAYNKRDLVKDTSTDNVFMANTSHTSSGSQPLTTNTDSAKWDLIVDAASATTSATNAATSATSAATSATNAATSETNAATSATTASTQATNASTSATNAATSETNASTSATNAATSETNASTSATSASTSASTATTQASNASTSATSASGSATTATTQASNASTSASTATTQASNASTSASNASTSETNAATSETNSASSATASAASATAAAATKDSIDEFYLGAQASNPTVDGNGDAVTAGDWYFNTGSNETRIYNGSAWQVTAIASAGLLTTANNLSDVASATTSRTNLGLGSLSTLSTIVSANITDGTIVDADINDMAASKLTGALPAIDGSALTGISGGKILQVVQTTKTDTFSTTTAIPSFTTVTGVSATITPSATSSKILVMVNGGFGNGSTNYAIAVNLLRDSTSIYQGDARGSSTRASAFAIAGGAGGCEQYAINYLDSPSTTSATTYYLQAGTESGGTTVIGGSSASGGSYNGSVPTNIILMEVSA